jgi:hypothetical protein
MAQTHNIRRKSKSGLISGPAKTGRKERLVFAYVSDVSSIRVLKRKNASLPKGLKVAIVSNKRVATSKISQVLPAAEEMQLYERPESDTPAPARVNSDAYKPDARARALLRGVALIEEDLKASGGTYSLEEVRGLMRGVSRQAVNNRVRDGSLLAVAGPSNRAVYPVVQFTADGTPVAGLKVVRKALQTNNDWMLLNFLVHPEPRLEGKKPIDLLKAGQVEKVVEAAQRVGVQGA